MLADPERKAALLARFRENAWYSHLGTFLKTGDSKRFHETMTAEEVAEYQSFFRFSNAGARLAAVAFTRPPTRVLDIGGSSGAIVKPLLDKYSGAHATIVDFPEVVAMWDTADNLGPYTGRIRYQVGNARTVEIEHDAYDLVILANLLHHLERSAVEDLLRRVARSLAPGASLAVLHGFPDQESSKDPLERLAALQFTLSSGEEAFPYADFVQLLAAEGVAAPVPADAWYIATKRS